LVSVADSPDRAHLLDRDLAAENVVAAQPHRAHATAADRTQYLIAAGNELGLHEVLTIGSAHPTAA
jgi:hypothetical protein